MINFIDNITAVAIIILYNCNYFINIYNIYFIFQDSQYLKNFAILVRNDNSTSATKPSEDDLCNRLENINVASGQFIRVNCTKALIGRYLTFKREGGPSKNAFSTCEVFVWTTSLGTSTKPRGESTKPGWLVWLGLKSSTIFDCDFFKFNFFFNNQKRFINHLF